MAGTEETTGWTDRLAPAAAELHALRERFGASWAVVWGPPPIAPDAAFASVLFEDRDPACLSALGMAVPIVGNPWAESTIAEGGALAVDAPHDPRLHLHQALMAQYHIVSVASGAARSNGNAITIVELYAQRPFSRPGMAVAEIQLVAQHIADTIAGAPHDVETAPAAGVLGDPIASAALHDLKSALAAQSFLTAIVEKDLRSIAPGVPLDPTRVRAMLEALGVMRESIDHATNLTRVMTLGSLAPGTRVAIDLPGIAQLALAAIPHDLRDRFDVIVDPGLAVLRPVSDAPSILRAVVNLVQNAALAIQRVKAARAFVRVRLDAGEGVLEVEDQGAGVPADVVPRLFQPGVTTGERAEGHGYGLYSARIAVESLGGTLTLYNVPRQGARFTIRLPRSVAGL